MSVPWFYILSFSTLKYFSPIIVIFLVVDFSGETHFGVRNIYLESNILQHYVTPLTTMNDNVHRLYTTSYKNQTAKNTKSNFSLRTKRIAENL